MVNGSRAKVTEAIIVDTKAILILLLRSYVILAVGNRNAARFVIRFVTIAKYESNRIESYRYEFISLVLCQWDQAQFD